MLIITSFRMPLYHSHISSVSLVQALFHVQTCQDQSLALQALLAVLETILTVLSYHVEIIRFAVMCIRET